MNKTAFESDAEASPNTQEFIPADTSKIPLREQYLLEKERIKQEIGDLEDIRNALGLSQRRLCKLLLVDPSAWTRWLRTPEGAPPHVYQALRWLMELRKSNPGVIEPRDLSSRVDLLQSATQSKIKFLEEQVARLEKALSLTATVQPVSTLDSSSLEGLLRLHQNTFEKELDELRAKVALLVEATSQKRRFRKKPVKRVASKKARARGTQKKTERSRRRPSKEHRAQTKQVHASQPSKASKASRLRKNASAAAGKLFHKKTADTKARRATKKIKNAISRGRRRR